MISTHAAQTQFPTTSQSNHEASHTHQSQVLLVIMTFKGRKYKNCQHHRTSTGYQAARINVDGTPPFHTPSPQLKRRLTLNMMHPLYPHPLFLCCSLSYVHKWRGPAAWTVVSIGHHTLMSAPTAESTTTLVSTAAQSTQPWVECATVSTWRSLSQEPCKTQPHTIHVRLLPQSNRYK